MAYEEPSLKQTLYQILQGLQSEKSWRETGEGLQRLRQNIPGVAESVARGAIASVPGSVGDISEFARSFAPKTMESTFGRRVAPTTREILDFVPRFTPSHEGATTLEDVGAAIAPGVGGLAKDAALLTKNKPLGLMMIGPESKIWNKEMAFNARKLEAKGETPEQIYEKTGMVRGLDNQWRQELSDKFATLKGTGTYGETVMDRMSALGKDKTAEPVTLNDIFYHPKLAEAYPELMNTEVQFTKKGSQNKGELVHTNEGYIVRVNPDFDAEKAKSTLLHEIQHAVQGQEGWNRGANYAQQVEKYQSQKDQLISVIEELNQEASNYLKAGDKNKYEELMNTRDDLAKQYIHLNPEKEGYQDYLKHGGEAESRLVQNRMNLSPEELKQYFPFQKGSINYGLDINPDEAIIATQHPRSINLPTNEYEYRGSHQAPRNDDYHSPAHELDRGMYPEDVYGPMGHHYYGEGDRVTDRAVLKILNEARGNPEHPITVYRAVPAEFKDQEINPGDWVTPTLDYAHKHGLKFDSHHIIEKTVPAKHLWSEGNSLHEFGYDPTD